MKEFLFVSAISLGALALLIQGVLWALNKSY